MGQVIQGVSLLPEKVSPQVFAGWCRAYSGEVLRTMKRIIEDEKASNGHKIAAGSIILERAFGKAPQLVAVDRKSQVNVSLEGIDLAAMAGLEHQLAVAIGSAVRNEEPELQAAAISGE